MRISVLVDDLESPSYCVEHGLSLFIETGAHRILFDTGSTAMFGDNARKLGIDLSTVDIAAISHGHNDHGGGIPAFLEINSTAPIYMSEHAFEPHFTKRKTGAIQFNGLTPDLLDSGRIVLTGAECRIDDELLLFSDVTGNKLRSGSNDKLLVTDGKTYQHDPFLHEQNMLIQEGTKNVLIAGCAHRGIVNIMDRAMELAGGPMDLVIGGFHLSNPRDGGCEPRETIDAIADYMLSFPTMYYTCHCTGTEAYGILKEKMGGKLEYALTGKTFEV